jgi:hypothetical protein
LLVRFEATRGAAFDFGLADFDLCAALIDCFGFFDEFLLFAIRFSLVSLTASCAATGTSRAIGRGDGSAEVAMGGRPQRHHTRSS